MRRLALLVVLMLTPAAGYAEAPMPRPQRPAVAVPVVRPPVEKIIAIPRTGPRTRGNAGRSRTAVALSIRPQARPALSPRARIVATAPEAAPRRATPDPSPRKAARRDDIDVSPRPPRADRGGAICGVLGLVAARRPPVSDPGGCGISDPVVVSQVAGVTLRGPALLSCRAVQALDRWVRSAAIPAVGQRGGGLGEMEVAAHYACRPRNNQDGAKLSEHGKGNAIDISSFAMRDGSRVGVQNGWRGKPRDRKLLHRLHDSACGPFGTVLGPDGDRFHQTHLHFDVAEYRSGTYCR